MDEYKIVVHGSGGVGKSSLTLKFVTGQFVEEYDPTIEDYYRKKIDTNSSSAVIEILDTAGIEQFGRMRDRYIENGHGFLLVYSIIDQRSFADVKILRDQILKVKKTQREVPILLVGNKIDLEEQRTVFTSDGRSLAIDWLCPFVETSAKTNVNVEKIFTGIVQEVIKLSKSSCCTLF